MENPFLFSNKIIDIINIFRLINNNVILKGEIVAKEKNDRIVQFVVRPSFYKEFEKICDKEEKTISAMLRELMLKRIREDNP